MDLKSPERLLDNPMKKSLVFKFENETDSQVLCINLADKQLNDPNPLFKSSKKEATHLRNLSHQLEPQEPISTHYESHRDLTTISR